MFDSLYLIALSIIIVFDELSGLWVGSMKNMSNSEYVNI